MRDTMLTSVPAASKDSISSADGTNQTSTKPLATGKTANALQVDPPETITARNSPGQYAIPGGEDLLKLVEALSIPDRSAADHCRTCREGCDRDVLAQEARYEIFMGKPRYANSDRDTYSWAWRVAKNTIASYHKRRYRFHALVSRNTKRLGIDASADEHDPSTMLEATEEMAKKNVELALARRAIEQLTSDDADFITLSFYGNLTLNDISILYEISINKAKKLRQRAYDEFLRIYLFLRAS